MTKKFHSFKDSKTISPNDQRRQKEKEKENKGSIEEEKKVRKARKIVTFPRVNLVWLDAKGTGKIDPEVYLANSLAKNLTIDEGKTSNSDTGDQINAQEHPLNPPIDPIAYCLANLGPKIHQDPDEDMHYGIIKMNNGENLDVFLSNNQTVKASIHLPRRVNKQQRKVDKRYARKQTPKVADFIFVHGSLKEDKSSSSTNDKNYSKCVAVYRYTPEEIKTLIEECPIFRKFRNTIFETQEVDIGEEKYNNINDEKNSYFVDVLSDGEHDEEIEIDLDEEEKEEEEKEEEEEIDFDTL